MVKSSENDIVSVKIEMLPARDGKRMYTIVAVPKGFVKCPTVMIRNPYEGELKGDDLASMYSNDSRIRNGYALVIQHCRGRGGSEGDHIPYKGEREDGLDLIEHIRSMSHYNGEIFLTGGSYLASTMLMLMGDDLTDVKGAVICVQTDRMYFRNYQNGCCRTFSGAEWWFAMMGEHHPKIRPNEEIYVRPFYKITERALGEDITWFSRELVHDTYDSIWQSDCRTYVMEKTKIPTLFIDGWFDFYTYGMCSMWKRLNQETKAQSCFLMGPYGHATAVASDFEYPLPNGNIPGDPELDWFEHIRLGRPFTQGKIGSFNYYDIGSDEWVAAEYEKDTVKKLLAEHPERSFRLYFTKDRRLAAGRREKGELSYIYDPENIPGGFRFQCMAKAFEPGTVPGVTSFYSDPFEQTKRFFGEVKWHMKVRSDCEDTAFFMRIYLSEGGSDYIIAETITSLSYVCPDYIPGTVAEFEIKTQLAGFTVKRGCSIRCDISSFADEYVPHANVKGKWALVDHSKVAKNTLVFGDSEIILCEKA